LLITCEDNEAIVIYQGELPVSSHLRAQIPIPQGTLPGKLTITATLVIAPEIDPAFSNSYTRGGIEVVFRPNDQKFKKNKDGKYSKHPETTAFFNTKFMWGNNNRFDALMSEDALKWEPVKRASRRFLASTIKSPVFDIYHHQRAEASQHQNPQAVPYALVVSVAASAVTNYYDKIVREYAGILNPIRPILRVPYQISSRI
jgi:hypothetical protein